LFCQNLLLFIGIEHHALKSSFFVKKEAANSFEGDLRTYFEAYAGLLLNSKPDKNQKRYNLVAPFGFYCFYCVEKFVFDATLIALLTH